MQTISHATTILGWLEHLTEEDMPPQWMWPLSKELERHFEKVKERRNSGRSDSSNDDDDGLMIRNEYAQGRGREAAANRGG